MAVITACAIAVCWQAKAGKKESKGYSLIFYLTDVTDFELLRQKYANEKLCLAYVRFDNYEDVTKGMGESTRANISGEVNEVLSKWAEEENGFILATIKKAFWSESTRLLCRT